MIYYRKIDGTLGEFNKDNLFRIDVSGDTFTVTLRHYGWDEYDVYYDEITDIKELKI